MLIKQNFTATKNIKPLPKNIVNNIVGLMNWICTLNHGQYKKFGFFFRYFVHLRK